MRGRALLSSVPIASSILLRELFEHDRGKKQDEFAPRSGGRTVLGAKERRVREPTPQEETAAQAKE